MTLQDSVTNNRDELRSSNFMQLELIRGVTEQGATTRMPARGFSMSPFIRDGDVLVIAPVRSRKLRLGDVVAFTFPGSNWLAIHRIIAKLKDGWLVRGDNSLQADGVISEEGFLGVVIQVERDGRIVRLGMGLERAAISLLSRSNLLLRIRAWIRYLRGWLPSRKPQ